MGKKKATPKTVDIRSLTLLGFVVRYSRPIDHWTAKPLHFGNHSTLVEGNALWLHGPEATVFRSEDDAEHAIKVSRAYQRRNGLRWNEMYGHYRIDPVYL